MSPIDTVMLTSGASQTSAAGMGKFSMGMAFIGAGLKAVGAYQQAEATRYQLGEQEADLKFGASIADINARQAEEDAQAIIESGQMDKALATLRHGQRSGARRASRGGSGLVAGVGSEGEVATSEEIAKDLEAGIIEMRTLRAAQAARVRAQEFRTQALLARTQAANTRIFRSTIKPGLSVLTSLIGSAGRIAPSHLNRQQLTVAG